MLIDRWSWFAIAAHSAHRFRGRDDQRDDDAAERRRQADVVDQVVHGLRQLLGQEDDGHQIRGQK